MIILNLTPQEEEGFVGGVVGINHVLLDGIVVVDDVEFIVAGAQVENVDPLEIVTLSKKVLHMWVASEVN